MLAEDESLVDMSKAVKEYPEYTPLYSYSNEILGDISKSGVFGDATLASKVKGEKMFDEFTAEISQLIEYALDNLEK